jgi:acyl-ACP thioesterase
VLAETFGGLGHGAAQYVRQVGADDFVERPHAGRVVAIAQRVGLGDTRPDGRLRLDALADYLQDVADEDAATAGIADDASVWILRRLTISVSRTPRFRDALTLCTWASGTGARWAERRTDVMRDGDTIVRASGVWVHVDRRTGRPTPLPPAFDAVWGDTARDRAVRARLSHPAPPPDEARREPWPLRATDIDVVGHANNAAYWAAVEEQLARRAGTGRVARAEIEFRAGIAPAEAVELAVTERDGRLWCWFTVAGEARASASVTSRP